MFPERLHSVALAIDVTTSLLSTADPSLTGATRARLERLVTRYAPD